MDYAFQQRVLAIILLGLILSNMGLCSESAGAIATVPREAVVCGPNSLLMFLTLCGTEVEDRFIDEIPCGDEGASFLQLRDASNAAGVIADVRRIGFSDLDRLPLPAIAQSKTRHYFVIYDIDHEHLYVLDGTTGREFKTKRTAMGAFFSGYVMVPRHSQIRVSLLSHIGVNLFWCCVVVGNISLCAWGVTYFRRKC